MLVEVRVPVLAESIAEATLMDWRKQPGDPVKFGDALIDVETDKVTLEVVAPQDGMLVKILKNSGEDVVSDELIAQIDTDGQAAAAAPEPAAESAPVESGPAQEPEDEPRDAATPEQTGTEAAGDAQQAAPAPRKRKLSPAVRNLLGEHGLDAADIPASGDRLTKKDVLAHLETLRAGAPDPGHAQQAGAGEAPDPGHAQQAGTGEAPVTEAAAPRPAQDEERGGTPKRVPMTRLRRRAAERLLAAQRENAILTTFNEVNMKPVMDLRNRYRDSFEKTHKVKLGFMSFFTKAAIEALKKFPIINASVDGADIVYHDYFDIGIAVSSPRGLVVPVLRAADVLSFADIEKTISELGQKARDAKLTLDDLTGGTFTITNGGVFGSLLSTPIINPPQSAILGMHKIEERPVAEDGAVVVRPMMYLALSYDHRIIDGREAVSFLVAIKEALEDPSRLLLQI